MRVFLPIGVEDFLLKKTCWICGRNFKELERPVLLAKQTSEEAGSLTVEAAPCHATCALRGRETARGIIDFIKDGDGSPFPVVMTNGRQYRLSEVGLDE
jgi:hypothetical protein